MHGWYWFDDTGGQGIKSLVLFLYIYDRAEFFRPAAPCGSISLSHVEWISLAWHFHFAWRGSFWLGLGAWFIFTRRGSFELQVRHAKTWKLNSLWCGLVPCGRVKGHGFKSLVLFFLLIIGGRDQTIFCRACFIENWKFQFTRPYDPQLCQASASSLHTVGN